MPWYCSLDFHPCVVFRAPALWHPPGQCLLNPLSSASQVFPCIPTSSVSPPPQHRSLTFPVHTLSQLLTHPFGAACSTPLGSQPDHPTPIPTAPTPCIPPYAHGIFLASCPPVLLHTPGHPSCTPMGSEGKHQEDLGAGFWPIGKIWGQAWPWQVWEAPRGAMAMGRKAGELSLPPVDAIRGTAESSGAFRKMGFVGEKAAAHTKDGLRSGSMTLCSTALPASRKLTTA